MQARLQAQRAIARATSIRHVSSKLKDTTVSPQRLGIKALIAQDLKHAESLGVLAPTPPDATAFRKVIHSTIELTKFYFRGAKLIYTRGKDIRAIRARIREGGFPLTRGEGRMIELQRKDVNKLIPFVIMAILLEEIIPVVAIFAPFLLPSTCILPGQKTRIEDKKTKAAISSASSPILANIKGSAVDGKLPASALKWPGSASVMCGLLRLPTFGNDLLRTWRIKRHLRFIESDDKLLIQDNLLDALNDHDLAQALEERGFIIEQLAKQDQHSKLKWWLDSVKTHSDDAVGRRLLLLTERR